MRAVEGPGCNACLRHRVRAGRDLGLGGGAGEQPSQGPSPSEAQDHSLKLRPSLTRDWAQVAPCLCHPSPGEQPSGRQLLQLPRFPSQQGLGWRPTLSASVHSRQGHGPRGHPTVSCTETRSEASLAPSPSQVRQGQPQSMPLGSREDTFRTTVKHRLCSGAQGAALRSDVSPRPAWPCSTSQNFASHSVVGC